MTTSPAGRNPQFARLQRTRLNLAAGHDVLPTTAAECANFVPPHGDTLQHRGGHSYLWAMTTRLSDDVAEISAELAAAVDEYRRGDDLGALLDRLRLLADRATPDALAEASEPFREVPEVVIPVYEHLVASRPGDARAMVVLANAYWLTGRGPEVVDALASRAVAADPGNRGAWHLWALAEPRVRERVARWRQVAERFPADQLARAALADNAASLAGAERDPLALDLAIATYGGLLAEAADPAQRSALERAIETLKGWRL